MMRRSALVRSPWLLIMRDQEPDEYLMEIMYFGIDAPKLGRYPLAPRTYPGRRASAYRPRDSLRSRARQSVIGYARTDSYAPGAHSCPCKHRK